MRWQASPDSGSLRTTSTWFHSRNPKPFVASWPGSTSIFGKDPRAPRMPCRTGDASGWGLPGGRRAGPEGEGRDQAVRHREERLGVVLRLAKLGLEDFLDVRR